jgi:hypothetical protein
MKFTTKILLGGMILSSSLFLSISISAAAPLKLDAQGHLGFTGGPPLSCDPNVTVTGTDNAGVIIFPPNSGFADCSFEFNQPYLTAPTCFVSWSDPSVHNLFIDTATNNFFIQSGDISNQIVGKVFYHCFSL